MGSQSSKKKQSEETNEAGSFDLPAGMIRLFIIGLRPSPTNLNQACCKDVNGNIITINNDIKIAWIVCDPRITIAVLKKTIMLELSLTDTTTANFLLIHNHLILDESCDTYTFTDYNIENNSCLFLAMNADIAPADSTAIEYEKSEFQIEMLKTYPSLSDYQAFKVKTITALDIVMYEENHNCVQMPECLHGMTVDGLYEYSLSQFNSKEKQIACPHLITVAESKLDVIDEDNTPVDVEPVSLVSDGNTQVNDIVIENIPVIADGNVADIQPLVVDNNANVAVLDGNATDIQVTDNNANVANNIPAVENVEIIVVEEVAANVDIIEDAAVVENAVDEEDMLANAILASMAVVPVVPAVVENAPVVNADNMLANALFAAIAAPEVPPVVPAVVEVPSPIVPELPVEVKSDDENTLIVNAYELTPEVTALQGERICGQTWHYIFIRKILIFTMLHQKQVIGKNVLSVNDTTVIKTVPSKVVHKTDATPTKKRLSLNMLYNAITNKSDNKNTSTVKSNSTSNDNSKQELGVVMEVLNPQESESFVSYEGSTEQIIRTHSTGSTCIVVEKQFTLNDILNLDLVCCRVTAGGANYELQQCPSCKSFLYRRKQRKWLLSKKSKTDDDNKNNDDDNKNNGDDVKNDDDDVKNDDEEIESNGVAPPTRAADDINLAFLLDLSVDERMAELRVECRVCNNIAFCWYCTKEWQNTLPVVTSIDADGNTTTSNEDPEPIKMCSNGDCPSHCFEAQALQLLAECDVKKIGSVTDVPSIRSCPKCAQLITHTEGCKHMQCSQCKCKFCFVCMSVYDTKWSCGSSSAVCPLAIRQSQEIFNKKVEEVEEPKPEVVIANV